MNDVTFDSVVNGVKTQFRLKAENLDIERKCDTEYHLVFTELMQRGILPKAALEALMDKNGIWTKEQEQVLTDMQHELAELQLKLSQAETHELGLAIAKEMGDKRSECLRLVEVKAAVLGNSCEALADSVRRDAYIAYSLVYADTGKKVFKDYEEFVARAEEQIVLDARKIVLDESIEAFNSSLSGLPEVDYVRKVQDFMEEEEENLDEDDDAPVATKKVTRKKTVRKGTARKKAGNKKVSKTTAQRKKAPTRKRKSN